MNRKLSGMAWRRSFAFLHVLGIGALTLLSTTTLINPCVVSAAPEEFFRQKFECARWVEKKAPDKKCLECHSGILTKENLLVTKRGVPGTSTMRVHSQHMYSAKVNFTCGTCHQKVDPYQSSSAGLRDQVSPNMCFKCHFPHGQDRTMEGAQK